MKITVQPRVSIIIPTYNRAHLIGETLESVLAQSFQNWECIVVDDGSSDYTVELLEFYCALDKRIKFYHRPKQRKKNASTCRNIGFEKSKGFFIQYLDSDDLLEKHKIKLQVLAISPRKNVLATCSYQTFLTKTTEAIPRNKAEIYRDFLPAIKIFGAFGKSNAFFPPSVYLVPRNLILRVGIWNENLDLNDDGEFFTRVILEAASIHFEPNTCIYYRNFSGDNIGIYNNKDKIRRGIISWNLIECYLKLRDKNFHLWGDYINNAKKSIFYTLGVYGFLDLANEYPEFFQKELEKWNIEEKKRKSFSRYLNRLKRFIEVKLMGMD